MKSFLEYINEYTLPDTIPVEYDDEEVIDDPEKERKPIKQQGGLGIMPEEEKASKIKTALIHARAGKDAPGHVSAKRGDYDQSTSVSELVRGEDKRTAYQGRVSADQIKRGDEVANFAARSHNRGIAGY